jgi:peptidoglycan/LPS O-acetylase OafA/YrhL
LLGVLAFHANGALPGGYLGVDLFFVLSGFLITRLLLAEHRATGRIDLWSFWVRRARRLFPALLALMPAIGLYATVVSTPAELAGIRADAVATLGYVANWHAILSDRSYWELFLSPSPLEHTWSLAIEEQFYVVWPLGVGVGELLLALLPCGVEHAEPKATAKPSSAPPRGFLLTSAHVMAARGWSPRSSAPPVLDAPDPRRPADSAAQYSPEGPQPASPQTARR